MRLFDPKEDPKKYKPFKSSPFADDIKNTMENVDMILSMSGKTVTDSVDTNIYDALLLQATIAEKNNDLPRALAFAEEAAHRNSHKKRLGGPEKKNQLDEAEVIVERVKKALETSSAAPGFRKGY